MDVEVGETISGVNVGVVAAGDRAGRSEEVGSGVKLGREIKIPFGLPVPPFPFEEESGITGRGVGGITKRIAASIWINPAPEY